MKLLHAFWLLLLANSPVVLAEFINAGVDTVEPTGAVQLTGSEIVHAFSNVRDDAEVQDTAATRAVNYWHADGRFFNRWHNGEASGEVSGTWRVENNLRCITILTGLSERLGQESCRPVFRRGTQYLSFNGDGSIHGIHTLSPLSAEHTHP
ncbi:MAG: hypothetical protein AB8C02_09745 [Halioglobus sp.]